MSALSSCADDPMHVVVYLIQWLESGRLGSLATDPDIPATNKNAGIAIYSNIVPNDEGNLFWPRNKGTILFVAEKEERLPRPYIFSQVICFGLANGKCRVKHLELDSLVI